VTDQPAAPADDAAPAEEAASGPAPRQRRRRSPIIDLAVILFGGYLLVTMFGDVRYFVQGATPRDLGDASTLVENGLPSDLSEQFVTLRGTPDVQRKARTKTGEGENEKTVRYLRIVEGGGSLFAAIPGASADSSNQFEGVFTGRMRRLQNVRMLPWIEDYFNGERIAESRDLTAKQLASALEKKTLRPDEQISLSVDQPDVRIQLGRSSFASREAAVAAVQALGFPYFAPEDQPSAAFYTLFARIPQDQRAQAQTTLAAAGTPPPGDKPDPRFGALVVPFTTTYLVPAADLELSGGHVSFVHGDSTTSPGYILDGAVLKPRPLDNGRLRILMDDLRAIGVVRSVRVDPQGYIILVDEQPLEQWPALALWLVVLGVVGWNITSLALLWRRRTA
jgi:hypothetical protein